MNQLECLLRAGTARSPVWVGGERIAFIQNGDEGPRVWELDLKTGEATQRTFGNERIWSIHGDARTGDILFCMDRGGNEHEQVYLLEHETPPEVKKYVERTTRELRNVAGTPELDIRGMASDEAMPVLDQFLDNAVMAKLSSARIIHGKGTGVLRKAVHAHLKHSRYVKSFRLGTFGEGEDGVTIVEF